MRRVHQSRTFQLLISTGALSVLLLGLAVFRTVVAGCPDGQAEGWLTCLFFPTSTDLGTHLVSYVFIGTIVLGISAGLLLWRRQSARTRSFTANLMMLRAPEEELSPLFSHLGLEGRICLVKSEAPLCFCAGFISPRIYISYGTMSKLTLEELEALLLHEKHHLSNRVPLKILAGRCISSILFFLPHLKNLLQRYLIEVEIAADQSAIQQQGHRRSIAGALEKLVQQYSARPMTGSAVGMTAARAYRIDHLTGRTAGYTYPIEIPRIITSLLVMTLILATILIPLPSAHPISDHLASAVPTLSGLAIGL